MKKCGPFLSFALVLFMMTHVTTAQFLFTGGTSGTDKPKKAKNEKSKNSGNYLSPKKLDDRTYYLYVPDAWQNQLDAKSADDTKTLDTPPVLIIWLHPSGGNAQPYYNWLVKNHKAMIKNYVVLAPQSKGRAWSFADDPKFVDNVIEKIINDHQLDPDRVIIGGHSSGAMFSYTYALQRPGKFFMLTPAAGAIRSRIQPANCKAPFISIYHSTNDQVVPYKTAQNSIQQLRQAGYRVQLFTDKRNHNVHTATVQLLVDGAEFLDRTYSAKIENKTILDRFGGEPGLETLWKATSYKLHRTPAVAQGKPVSLRRMRNIIDILLDPASHDFEKELKGKFIPGQTLVCQTDKQVLIIQFSTDFSRLRTALTTPESPPADRMKALDEAPITAIKPAAKIHCRKWIVPLNCD